ncbi:KOW motif domain-containing protein [Clathrospora elynae]|uniref:KOW motif domain-containing protein n=1 Tax=Clathrospora elynae TaxID=706981 RepID=A0A6A5SML4_9PLEO|nr:KOW motif domain-containing protein [Clathrospora elynae]
MSQLAVRPGRNAARQAKKLKEMRHVKNAIVWHERERKKRQELQQERWDSKQAVIQRIKWQNEHIRDVRKNALANAREDWKLGPLRPNRAIGDGADKYGALTANQMQKPEIPVRTQKNRNEHRERKGLEPEYPLVVDDKKYFPIVENDRVVVLKGRDAGKIGVVQDIIERTHEVIVKGINMQYYDSDVYNAAASDGMGPKHENEVPVPLANVRLVVPSETVKGNTKHYEDVIVEKIFMERHTTGIDPYTGTDYGDAEIPEHHQYDPGTGLPIFYRYIAGTRHRIEWPWERSVEVEDSGTTEKTGANRQSWFRKTMGTISSPITSLKSWRNKSKESAKPTKKAKRSLGEKIEEIEKKQAEKFRGQLPKSQELEVRSAVDNVDSTRNIVEDAQSMAYTLVAPPFPDTLGEELRGDIHEFAIKAKKDPEAPRGPKTKRPLTEQGIIAREAAREKKRAAEAMKTPMQLRWELEHAKKVEGLKKNPLVDTDTLLLALGQHMQKAAVKPRKGKAPATEQVQELD